MSLFYQILEFLKSLVIWWFVVEPWDKAIRVRWGKNVKLFEPGLYFKIPFLDILYVHNIRRRTLQVDPVTLSNARGQVYVASCMVGYVVEDVLKLHQNVLDPEGVLKQRVYQVMAEFFLANSDITPAALQDALQTIKVDDLGLAGVEVSICNFAAVQTYRLIQDSMAGPSGYERGGTKLSTVMNRML